MEVGAIPILSYLLRCFPSHSHYRSHFCPVSWDSHGIYSHCGDCACL